MSLALTEDANTLNQMLAALRSSEHSVSYVLGASQARAVGFEQLYARALGVLHHFHQAGVQQGDQMVLFTQSNEQFIDGFWACLLGGIVPVPIAVGISDEHRLKLLRVFEQLNSAYLYTEISLRKRLEQFAEAHDLRDAVARMMRRSLVVDEIKNVSVQAAPADVSPQDTAFIQFSSGSTSAPKGVVLTHANVVSNIRAIAVAAKYSERDIGFSWMPLTHDMGMIGFHLGMLVANMPHYIMDTALFVRRPLLWLQKLSEHRASVTCSPNFGYKHVLKMLEAKGVEALDLSAVRVIFNGAEPISVPLSQQFLSALAPHGLSSQAMWPVYGLAEASVAVSIPDSGSAQRFQRLDRHALAVGQPVQATDDDALEVMCVGRAINDCEVRITGPSGEALAERHVGHVEIRGLNVTAGYYTADGQPDALTREAMRGEGWLDTGDLGFLDDQGELYITGREKDIIFVNGQNYYPHDLESVLHELDDVQMGKLVVTAARAADVDEDQILVFVQHRGELDAFAAQAASIRRHLNERTGLESAHVLAVERIPKTTSGKVQRAHLSTRYEQGDFDAQIAAHAQSRGDAGEGGEAGNAIEQQLMQICAEVVTDWAIAPEDNLFDIGISSMSLVEIHERIDELYPQKLDITEIFDAPSVREIAAMLGERV